MTLTMNEAGVRKAAILMVQLGPEHASKVLGHLDDSEVEAISAEITRLESLDAEETDAVVTEFHELANARANLANGGPQFARALLEQTLGAERAESIMGRLDASRRTPFQFLERVPPRQLLPELRRQHSQVTAVVLAHMPHETATAVLAGLDAEVRADVAHRVAVMSKPSPDALRALEEALVKRLSSAAQAADDPAVGGLEPLVGMINSSDRATERLILEALEQRDPDLAEQVRSRMFGFEDILLLEDKDLQLVLRQVDAADLAMALKGISTELRTKITSNISERAAENLLEEVDLLGAVPLAKVEEAQGSVVRKVRELLASGQITVRRGSDEAYVS